MNLRSTLFWTISIKDFNTMLYLYLAGRNLSIGNLFITDEIFVIAAMVVLLFSMIKCYIFGLEKLEYGLYIPILFFLYLTISGYSGALVDGLTLAETTSLIGITNAWILSIVIRLIIIYSE